MLTCARPSASAISATVPGRFSTADPQLAQLAAVEVGLEQPAAVVARGARASRRPRRRRRRGSARRLAQRARRPRRSRRRPPRGWWRRCRPRSPGWRRRPGSCRESSSRPPAGARTPPRAPPRPRWTSTLASTCGRWLTVAITRSWVVGVDRLRAGAEVGDGALQAVVVDAARALGRGQVPAGALEQLGARVLDPGGLGAGERMAADEARSPPAARPGPRSAPAWSSRRR